MKICLNSKPWSRDKIVLSLKSHFFITFFLNYRPNFIAPQKETIRTHLHLIFQFAFSLRFLEPEPQVRKAAVKMSVTLHTNLGDIKCEIFCDEVPKSAENFLALCASGYYDGTIFHRNIKGFMIQGGDPTGTGKGGTSIWGKKFNDEIKESLKHNARGILSMANSGANTNGSQFFITYAKQPHLNGLYTVFGRVIHGFEVLDIMEKTQTGPGDRPLAEIRLNRVTIHANPLAG
ncbi:peptidyl-prolyl cis-trans isomerase CYP18-1 [Benincasa hispida]|nr:peptidyl-prolyl cis-trans isomerase CYP18-1 [Benincasa hispida]